MKIQIKRNKNRMCGPHFRGYDKKYYIKKENCQPKLKTTVNLQFDLDLIFIENASSSRKKITKYK